MAVDYGLSLAKQLNAIITTIHVLPQEIRYEYESVDAIQPNIPATPIKGIVEVIQARSAEKNGLTKL